MSANAREDVEASIRACVATPSRVVLFFDGEPDTAAAQEGANYEIVKAGDPSSGDATSPPEYDPGSRVTVLRNPVSDAEVGEWLQITVFGVRPTGPPITHFVRVESELPLLRTGLGEEAAVQAERDKRPSPTATDPTQPDRSNDPDAKRRTSSAPSASGRRHWPDFTPAPLVVVTGLVALLILGVVAMLSASTGDMGTIATGAFGVIGSVIGAFFGVHAGLGDRKRVDTERRVEATKGQMLAAMMPEDKKQDALEMLKAYSPSERDARTS